MADVTASGRAVRARIAAAISDYQSSRLAWLISGVAMVLVLLAPAILNGFPLIFPDTGGYLERPILGTLGVGRSALYGLFLYMGIPFSFWPNVIAQAVLTVWLVVLTMRVLGLGGRPWLALSLVATLCVVTSLPWLAGQLMPDILFPAAALSIYLLVFRADVLTRWERIGLATLIAVAIPSHMAAAGLSAGMVLGLWLLSRLPRIDLPKPRIALAAGAVAVGIVLCPVSNYAITGQFALTPGGTGFLFGRLVDDGIIERYLEERCPDPALSLCAHMDDMPDEVDDWLWGHDSPLYKLGGWEGHKAEQEEIIWDTFRRYPLEHLAAAAMATFHQFITFATEVSVDDNGPAIESFEKYLPQLYPPLMKARQQAERPQIAPYLNVIHVPVAALAIAGVVGALVFRRRLGLSPHLTALCVTLLIALAANAAVCGIFSHAVDRYGSRLVLLAPFVILLIAASRQRPESAAKERASG